MNDKELAQRFIALAKDQAEYSPYTGTREVMKAALDLSQPLKVSVPKRHTGNG